MRDETVSIWPLGSVQQLQKEIEVFANVLEIPADLTSQSDDMLDALEATDTPEDSPLWRLHPIASYTALILKEACVESLKTGAAISFG